MHVDCDPRGKTWNYETCRAIAPLTLEINQLKREKDAPSVETPIPQDVLYPLDAALRELILPGFAQLGF